MQDTSFVIGGFEPAYMKKLAVYLSNRLGEQATVGIAESVPSPVEEGTVWIGSEAFVAAVREQREEALCIPLTEEPREEGAVVYRYQPCEKLYQQIMPLYRKLCGIPAYVSHAGKQRWIVVTGDGAAAELLAFSLTCAQILGKEEHTLYLNFSECSGMEELLLLERGTDLSDLVAALRRAELPVCLEAFTRQTEQFDYILSPNNPMILHELREEDMEHLIDVVEGQERYLSVVVALGTTCCGCEWIFRRATQLFHLSQTGVLRECAKREWERIISQSRGDEHAPIETVYLPQITVTGGGMYLLTIWEEGSMGQLARRYLSKEVPV